MMTHETFIPWACLC